MTLLDLLGSALTDEVKAKLPPETVKQLEHSVYLYDGNNKGLEPLPKYRVDEMTTSLKGEVENLKNQVTTLEGTLGTRDKDLKDLKKAAEGNEALTKQIETLQSKSKEEKESWEQEKQSLIAKEALLKKSLTLKEHLLNAGVGDVEARDLLSKKFDVEKLEFSEDGKIKGFEDLLKPIKENKAFAGMFGEIKFGGDEHAQGDVKDTGKEFYTRAEIESMSLQDTQANLEKVNKSMAQLNK